MAVLLACGAAAGQESGQADRRREWVQPLVSQVEAADERALAGIAALCSRAASWALEEREGASDALVQAVELHLLERSTAAYAEQVLQRVEEGFPRDAHAQRLFEGVLARVCELQGKHERALELARQLLAADPDGPTARHAELALRCLLALGRREQALQAALDRLFVFADFSCDPGEQAAARETVRSLAPAWLLGFEREPPAEWSAVLVEALGDRGLERRPISRQGQIVRYEVDLVAWLGHLAADVPDDLRQAIRAKLKALGPDWSPAWKLPRPDWAPEAVARERRRRERDARLDRADEALRQRALANESAAALRAFTDCLVVNREPEDPDWQALANLLSRRADQGDNQARLALGDLQVYAGLDGEAPNTQALETLLAADAGTPRQPLNLTRLSLLLLGEAWRGLEDLAEFDLRAWPAELRERLLQRLRPRATTEPLAQGLAGLLLVQADRTAAAIAAGERRLLLGAKAGCHLARALAAARLKQAGLASLSAQRRAEWAVLLQQELGRPTDRDPDGDVELLGALLERNPRLAAELTRRATAATLAGFPSAADTLCWLAASGRADVAPALRLRAFALRSNSISAGNRWREASLLGDYCDDWEWADERPQAEWSALRRALSADERRTGSESLALAGILLSDHGEPGRLIEGLRLGAAVIAEHPRLQRYQAAPCLFDYLGGELSESQRYDDAELERARAFVLERLRANDPALLAARLRSLGRFGGPGCLVTAVKAQNAELALGFLDQGEWDEARLDPELIEALYELTAPLEERYVLLRLLDRRRAGRLLLAARPDEAVPTDVEGVAELRRLALAGSMKHSRRLELALLNSPRLRQPNDP